MSKSEYVSSVTKPTSEEEVEESIAWFYGIKRLNSGDAIWVMHMKHMIDAYFIQKALAESPHLRRMIDN